MTKFSKKQISEQDHVYRFRKKTLTGGLATYVYGCIKSGCEATITFTQSKILPAPTMRPVILKGNAQRKAKGTNGFHSTAIKAVRKALKDI